MITLPNLEPYLQNSDTEIEARFGFYSKQRFNSNVRHLYYQRLLEQLRKLPGAKEIIQESIVECNTKYRCIKIQKEQECSIHWQEKILLINFDLYEYNIRISVNRERSIEPISNFVPVITRKRKRHTFLYKVVKVELSEVLLEQKQTYEVELEFNGTKDQLSIFQQMIEWVFKALYNTNIIYTNSLREQIITDVNNILMSKNKNKIDRSVLVDSRNIKRDDLVLGGIVGNQSIENPEVLVSKSQGTRYMVTLKVDGVRTMLIIHRSGVWLISPPYDYNFIGPLDNVSTEFVGTILDGELIIPKEQVIRTKYMFVGFDCIAFKGNKTVQTLPYTERKLLVTEVSKIKNQVLHVDYKETIELKPDNFFSVIKEILEKRDKVNYNVDGLIFFPIDTCYNPNSQKYPLEKRVLTRIPDVCKWKKAVDNTIDFAIFNLGSQIGIYCYDETQNKLVQFQGSKSCPLSSSMIDHQTSLALKVPNGTVVEYEWSEKMFRPRKIRMDKNSPNKFSIALAIWKDIINPISEQDLKGQTFMMAEYCINKIKFFLTNFAFSKRPSSVLYITTDITNDDVETWREVDIKITLAIDSSKHSEFQSKIREELEGRVNISTFDRVNGTFDVIIIFKHPLDDGMIHCINRNLKAGGYVVFLLLNIDTIKEIIKQEKNLKLDLNNQQVKITEPDTNYTVIEPVISLSLLTSKLKDFNINLKKLSRLDTQELLSRKDHSYCSLYYFGYYQK